MIDDTTDRYDVPAGADPSVCPYCGEPFRDESLRALHWGRDHRDDLDDEQWIAFEDVFEEETDQLRLFRLKSLVAIVLLYFGLLMTYALV